MRGRNKINDGLNRSNVNWSFGLLFFLLPLALLPTLSSFFIGCSFDSIALAMYMYAIGYTVIFFCISTVEFEVMHTIFLQFSRLLRHTQKKATRKKTKNVVCMVYAVLRTECMKAIFRVCAPAFQSDSELMFICFEV